MATPCSPGGSPPRCRSCCRATSAGSSPSWRRPRAAPAGSTSPSPMSAPRPASGIEGVRRSATEHDRGCVVILSSLTDMSPLLAIRFPQARTMWTSIRTRWMEWDWHGATLFNLRSPSSRPDLVKRIVDEFVDPKGSSVRILDVGGTRQGFVAHLPEEHRSLRERTYLLNPRGGAEIAFRSISEVPADTEPFELTMMFGVQIGRASWRERGGQ